MMRRVLEIGHFLFLSQVCFAGTPQFKDLEIYHPIRRHHVALANNGNLFLLDTKEDRIYLTKNGDSQAIRIAKKGQGPGEIEGGTSIMAVENQVFALDINGYSEFDANGVFQARHNVNNRVAAFIPSQRGFYIFNETDHSLFFAKFGENQPEKVFQWQEDRIYPEKRESYTYYPAWENTRVLVDSKQNFAFIFHTGTFLKISIIDLKDGGHRTLSHKGVQAIPFDNDWAQSEYEKRFKGNMVTLAKPAKFPVVKAVQFAPGERIVIELWAGASTHQNIYEVVDYSGEESPLKFDVHHASRIVAFNEKIAYISVFNADEEAFLVSCSTDEIDKTAEEFPWLPTEDKKDAWVSVQ